MPTYLLHNGQTYDEWADAVVNTALMWAKDEGLITTEAWEDIVRLYNYETSEAFEKIYQLGDLRIEVAYTVETQKTRFEVYIRKDGWTLDELPQKTPV